MIMYKAIFLVATLMAFSIICHSYENPSWSKCVEDGSCFNENKYEVNDKNLQRLYCVEKGCQHKISDKKSEEEDTSREIVLPICTAANCSYH